MNKQEWIYCKAKFQHTEIRWRTFCVVAFDILVLCAVFYFLFLGGFFILLSIVLLALIFLHLYLLLHEATHSAISRIKYVNDLIGHICGWIIVMPFLARKRSHLLHHAWTGHPEGDPANRRLIKLFSTITHKKTKTLEQIWLSWMPLFTLNDRVGLWKDAFQERKNGNTSVRIKKEINAVCLYVCTYFLLLLVLWQQGVLLKFFSIYLSVLLILFFMEELVNLPHHAETPLINHGDKALPYWEQDQVTHSCKSLPVWSSYVLLNFNLHTAHHIFPTAPWYSLPAIHKEVEKFLPDLEKQQRTHEISWSLKNRKRSLCSIMAPYVERAASLRKSNR